MSLRQVIKPHIKNNEVSDTKANILFCGGLLDEFSELFCVSIITAELAIREFPICK
jgi:hypothetical protein